MDVRLFRAVTLTVFMGYRIVTKSTEQWTSLVCGHWGASVREICQIRTGLSDSVVCELEVTGKRCCLKGTPDSYSSKRLRWIHGLRHLAVESGLEWIPAPMRTRNGDTCVPAEGMIWELSPWMSGAPVTAVSPEQCRNAMRALATLHLAWHVPDRGCADVVQERLSFARQCLPLSQSIAWDRLAVENSRYSWARDVMNVVAKSSTQIATVISQLVRWVDRQVPLQPVLRDIWSDHLLFEGNDVRGMIDFHAVRIGTVAGDIGRLLASWNLPVDGQWDQALAWYSEIHPLETDEVEFVHVLDQAARVLTPWVWLRWVLLEKRQFASFEKMNERVEWSFRRLLAGK